MKRSILFLLIVELFLASCSTSTVSPAETATAAPTETYTPTEKPTATATPPLTPTPTVTPDLAATQKAEDFQGLLQNFVEQGYLQTTEGETVPLKNFKQEWAQINWYRWWPVGQEVGNDFLFKAHFKWSTSSSTPDVSGCGVVFGLQNRDNHYAVFLDKAQILFLRAADARISKLSPARGSGRMKFGNPAEADFVLAVHGQNAYVSVDGGAVAEYALSATQPASGQLALTLLSGTNKGYGTLCEMSEVLLWRPK